MDPRERARVAARARWARLTAAERTALARRLARARWGDRPRRAEAVSWTTIDGRPVFGSGSRPDQAGSR